LDNRTLKACASGGRDARGSRYSLESSVPHLTAVFRLLESPSSMRE
jgi:hypothetical protein